MLETGDIGGDEFSGLTRYVEKPRQADVLLGSTSAGCRAAKPCGEGARELGPILRTFAPKKRVVTKR